MLPCCPRPAGWSASAAATRARVVAGDDFAPFAALAYDDQPAISFQCHPEFDPAYATALIESRREEKLTDEEADRAVHSLRRPNDRQEVAAWMRNFLTEA